MSVRTMRAAARQLPYNRTAGFSDLTRRLIDGLKRLFGTQEDVVIFTSSGTGAMEASVQNLLDQRDCALVVNGGVFGQRWVDLCRLHGVPCEDWKIAPGKALDPAALERRLASGRYTALLLTAHETSTGVLHDVAGLGRIAREHDLFFLVDAISTIGADPFHMDQWQVDAAVLSSQKALALPPGLAFVALSARARRRLAAIEPRTLYFRIRDYLENQKRGQMPFTPAVGLFLMLDERLREIEELTIDALVLQHADRARHFRNRLADLPLDQFPDRAANGLSALRVREPADAGRLAAELAARFEFYVAPNGGELARSLFRVGHFGDQTNEDLDALADALGELLCHDDSNSRVAVAAR